MKYISCCYDCGSKLYKNHGSMQGITVCIKECPICKKTKMIIPASDWAGYGD